MDDPHPWGKDGVDEIFPGRSFGCLSILAVGTILAFIFFSQEGCYFVCYLVC